MKIRTITLRELRQRSGVHFVDGRRVRLGYDFAGRTVQKGDEDCSGCVHKAQQQIGQKYFVDKGYRLFPHQIGVKSVMAMADFAAARFRNVILVECLADFQPDSSFVNSLCRIFSPRPSFEEQTNHLMRERIKTKIQLARFVELWFVVQPKYKQILENTDYQCQEVPNRYLIEFQELNTTFWICRPAKEVCQNGSH